MNTNYKVSIIIPVYNAEEYLHECLDSVCNQTYKNLEIVCVNDGSTDGSLAILNKYAEKDKRIIVVSQANAGQASARNAALDIVTGDWITGIDSDDYFDLSTIEKCMQHADEGVDVIHYGTFLFDETGKLDRPWQHIKYSGKVKITESVIPELHNGFCDKVWKRSLLEECNVKFPVGIHFEDMVFMRCCLPLANYIYFIPEQLYAYREREGSTMWKYKNKQGGRRVLDYLEVAQRCLSFWKERNIRERFGCSGPSYLEMELLINISWCMRSWGADEFQHEAWMGVRDLIDRFGIAPRLPEFPALALYYHLPPYARPKLRDFRNPNENKVLLEDMTLLRNERSINRAYRRFRMMSHLTWGGKRQKYKEKAQKYHELLRRCRKLRKETEALFKALKYGQW